MNSRQRLQATLGHRQPDRVCVDFGSTAVTGMHVAAVSRLRRAILGDTTFRVKVIEPYQMLGEIDEALREALGIDVVGLLGRTTLFGFENAGWRPFTLFDGTPVTAVAPKSTHTRSGCRWLSVASSRWREFIAAGCSFSVTNRRRTVFGRPGLIVLPPHPFRQHLRLPSRRRVWQRFLALFHSGNLIGIG